MSMVHLKYFLPSRYSFVHDNDRDREECPNNEMADRHSGKLEKLRGLMAHHNTSPSMVHVVLAEGKQPPSCTAAAAAAAG